MAPHNMCSFYAKTERKSMKCHDFNDLNLNDLKMAFKVNDKLFCYGKI